MKLTTTLNKIRACSPCTSGWKTLLTHLGKTEADDAEINLLTILESNGVPDMLWCLRTTSQDSKHTASQLAIEFAEQALPLFEQRRPGDRRPRDAIHAAREYLDGKITLEALRKARAASAASAAAAYTAYADAADAYAYAAAAADAAAASAADAYAAAAYAAAAYAADAAAAAYTADAAAYAADTARQKAREKQADTIRSILEW